MKYYYITVMLPHAVNPNMPPVDTLHYFCGFEKWRHVSFNDWQTASGNAKVFTLGQLPGAIQYIDLPGCEPLELTPAQVNDARDRSLIK